MLFVPAVCMRSLWSMSTSSMAVNCRSHCVCCCGPLGVWVGATGRHEGSLGGELGAMDGQEGSLGAEVVSMGCSFGLRRACATQPCRAQALRRSAPAPRAAHTQVCKQSHGKIALRTWLDAGSWEPAAAHPSGE